MVPGMKIEVYISTEVFPHTPSREAIVSLIPSRIYHLFQIQYTPSRIFVVHGYIGQYNIVDYAWSRFSYWYEAPDENISN